jgi:type VII secretion-associated serine protease mycosin
MLGAALLAVASMAAVPAAAGTAGRAGGVGAAAAAVPARSNAVRDAQWHLGQLRAADAWRISTGVGVTVAVVDSGVDFRQADLVGQVIPGNDFVMPGGDGRYDPAGHGTTVAGLIAGRRDDDSGVVGLAPDAKILPVRVLNEQRKYDDPLTVAKGIRWAVDYGADVINLSLGGIEQFDSISDALAYAFRHDVVVVACTGNVGAFADDGKVWYPARETGVIAVAGLEQNRSIWDGSVTGAATVLTAPAAGVQAAIPGGYGRVYGTSFAAPLVSAAAALVRSEFPAMGAGDVVNYLVKSATDLGAPGRDDVYGYGEVNPYGALTDLIPMIGRNPLGDLTPLTQSGFGHAPGRSAAAGTGGGVGAARAGMPGGPPGSARWIRLVAALTFVLVLTAVSSALRMRPRPEARVRPPPT